MKLGIVIDRSNTFDSKLKTLSARLGKRVHQGLQAAGETLLGEALQLTPVDTTALIQSSHVRTVGEGFETVVFVGFGIKGEVYSLWSDAEQAIVTKVPYDYAVYVHEVAHATHEQGQHDFLREPRQTKLPEMRASFNTAVMRG